MLVMIKHWPLLISDKIKGMACFTPANNECCTTQVTKCNIVYLPTRITVSVQILDRSGNNQLIKQYTYT